MLNTPRICSKVYLYSRLLLTKENGSNYAVTRKFSSKNEDWISVVGPPRPSPFGNDRRIIRPESERSTLSPSVSSSIIPSITQNVSLHTTKTTASKVDKNPERVDKEKRTSTSWQTIADEEQNKQFESQVASEGSRKPLDSKEYEPKPWEVRWAQRLRTLPGFAPTIFYRVKLLQDIPDFLSLPLEEQEKIIRDKKRTRGIFIGCYFMGGMILLFLVTVLYEVWPSSEERIEKGKGAFSVWKDNFLSYFTSWYSYIVEPSREILLPPPLPSPYHQPKYTLVLELKDVLLTNDWSLYSHRYKKRPGLDYFLEVVGYPNFEVVIYTEVNPMDDPNIFPSMDPHFRIMHRLYKDCCRWDGKKNVKVLEKLNRDLSKVIFIDTEPRADQPGNQLLIPKWTGDMNDKSLIDLAALLATIHISDVEDVRPTIKYYNDQGDPIKAFHAKVEELKAQEQARLEAQSRQSQSWTSKFGFSGFRKMLG